MKEHNEDIPNPLLLQMTIFCRFEILSKKKSGST